MKIVMAFVRASCLEAIGIREMSISEIKGVGQEVALFKPYIIHDRIDIIVPDDKADAVSKIILDYAKTEFAGDGILAGLPVECVIKRFGSEKRWDAPCNACRAGID